MCTIDQSIILSESKSTQISWYRSCMSYSLIHNSCCASFKADELKHFKEVLQRLKIEDYSFLLHGDPHAIIRNKNTSVGLCINPTDTKQIINMIEKAQTLSEAFEIIYH